VNRSKLKYSGVFLERRSRNATPVPGVKVTTVRSSGLTCDMSGTKAAPSSVRSRAASSGGSVTAGGAEGSIRMISLAAGATSEARIAGTKTNLDRGTPGPVRNRRVRMTTSLLAEHPGQWRRWLLVKSTEPCSDGHRALSARTCAESRYRDRLARDWKSPAVNSARLRCRVWTVPVRTEHLTVLGGNEGWCAGSAGHDRVPFGSSGAATSLLRAIQQGNRTARRCPPGQKPEVVDFMDQGADADASRASSPASVGSRQLSIG